MRTALVLALLGSAAGVTEEYKVKATKWKKENTRASFMKEFNKDRDTPISGPRADRLWNYLNEQLEYGGIVWKGDGMTYQVPMTHFLPLPDFFVDVIETCLKPLRKLYFQGMNLISDTAHETHHEIMEHLQEKGALQVIQIALGAFVAFSFVNWLIYRFTDGIFPSERKLAKETRALAAAYMAKKNN